jgi:hypothetical protein
MAPPKYELRDYDWAPTGTPDMVWRAAADTDKLSRILMDKFLIREVLHSATIQDYITDSIT